MNNDALLLQLAARDPSAVDWICAAARGVVEQRGALSLERLAGLAGTVAARKRGLRDAYLRQAAVALGGGRAVGPKSLHEAVERFRATRWQQWKRQRFAPDYASAVERSLFNAFAQGVEVPDTPQGIGRALRGNGIIAN